MCSKTYTCDYHTKCTKSFNWGTSEFLLLSCITVFRQHLKITFFFLHRPGQCRGMGQKKKRKHHMRNSIHVEEDKPQFTQASCSFACKLHEGNKNNSRNNELDSPFTTEFIDVFHVKNNNLKNSLRTQIPL